MTDSYLAHKLSSAQPYYLFGMKAARLMLKAWDSENDSEARESGPGLAWSS